MSTACSVGLNRACASAAIAGFRPSRPAICSAWLVPGMPMESTYVGASRSTSNSTLAFCMNSSTCASAFTAEKWLVATVGARLSRRKRRIACASADPSCGSVPAPSSSNSTSERSSASSRIGMILERCDENVERLCSMLCSSPMSACTCRNTARREPIASGQVQPALPHERQQPYGLERNGLAAGVRPGDDEHVERLRALPVRVLP